MIDKEEARAQLRDMLPPGSEVRTIARHTSPSGLTHWISVVVDGEDVSWLVARALGEPYGRGRHEGIKRGGAGMDIGFDLVYSLARTLYPTGFECTGREDWRGCPSNDHNNGDRGYGPGHRHSSGGYALTQRWL